MTDLAVRESSRARSRSRNKNKKEEDKRRLNRDFLHRCCVQFSPEFTAKNYVEELASHHQFVTRYVEQHCDEIARALVWRIVVATGGYDLLGAWRLLTSMYDVASSDSGVEGALLNRLDAFLLPLISAKWFSTKGTVQQPSTKRSDADDDPLEDMKMKLGITASRVASRAGTIVVSSTTSPEAAAANTQEATAAAYPATATDSVAAALDLKAVQDAFRELAETWLKCLRHDVASSIRRQIRKVSEQGNYMEPKVVKYLSFNEHFDDSLHKLRRKFPRPSNVKDVARYYGWKLEDHVDTMSNPLGLPRAEDVDGLSPMHPAAKQWLLKLAAGSCCLECDSWRHNYSHCPCVMGYQSLLPLPPREGAALPPRHRPALGPQLMPFGDAVAKLGRYGISLPITPTSIAKALDCVVQLIGKEMPYEDLLRALDSARGFSSTAAERHALWIISSFNLLPSMTVFAPRSGPHDQTATIQRAEHHLVDKMHRLKDFHKLDDAIETIASFYRDGKLPFDPQDALDELVKDKKYPYAFCFFDGTEGMDPFSVEECSYPDLLRHVRPYLHCLCQRCLTPFHKAEACKNAYKQPWDLRVALQVLDDHKIDRFTRSDALDERLETAYTSVDIQVLDSKENAFRKKQIQLAAQLLFHNKPLYCRACDMFGHSRARCEVSIQNALRQANLSITDIRLNPRKLEAAIARASEADRRPLEDAKQAYVERNSYPPRYATTVARLQAERFSVAVARYSPDAMEQYARYTNATDIIPFIEVCIEPRFPDVCVFCDSIHHATQDCDQCRSSERDFLSELEQQGVTLLQFSLAHLCPEKLRKVATCDPANIALQAVSRNPSAIVSMPTGFPEGRAAVLKYLQTHCVDPYVRGGLKRVQYDSLQSSLNTLRAAHIPLHFAKYYPSGIKQFLELHRRSELCSAVDTAHSLLHDVCFGCGSLSHDHTECKTLRLTGAEKDFIALLSGPQKLQQFVFWAVSETEPNRAWSGADEIEKIRNSISADVEGDLYDARKSIAKLLQNEYDLGSRGQFQSVWEKQNSGGSASHHTTAGTAADAWSVAAGIGRAFSKIVTAEEEEHVLVPDPEHVMVPQAAEEDGMSETQPHVDFSESDVVVGTTDQDASSLAKESRRRQREADDRVEDTEPVHQKARFEPSSNDSILFEDVIEKRMDEDVDVPTEELVF